MSSILIGLLVIICFQCAKSAASPRLLTPRSLPGDHEQSDESLCSQLRASDEVSNEMPFQLFVRYMQGTVAVDLLPTASVGDVRQATMSAFGSLRAIPFALSDHGRKLIDNEALLSDLGIGPEQVIDITAIVTPEYISTVGLEEFRRFQVDGLPPRDAPGLEELLAELTKRLYAEWSTMRDIPDMMRVCAWVNKQEFAKWVHRKIESSPLVGIQQRVEEKEKMIALFDEYAESPFGHPVINDTLFINDDDFADIVIQRCFKCNE